MTGHPSTTDAAFAFRDGSFDESAPTARMALDRDAHPGDTMDCDAPETEARDTVNPLRPSKDHSGATPNSGTTSVSGWRPSRDVLWIGAGAGLIAGMTPPPIQQPHTTGLQDR
ncbi:MAG: hypothetical protein ABL893_14140 [Hyphomicrobium sp.]